MTHLFCGIPSQAGSRIRDVVAAYELSPVSTVRLVSEAINECDRCFSIYKSLNISNLDFKREVVLYNFSLKMLYDWRFLLDRKVLQSFLSIRNNNEVYQGFRGFFAIMYGENKNNSPVELDLKNVSFTEEELNFFMDTAGTLCNGSQKVRGISGKSGGPCLDGTKYLAALHIYVSAPTSKLSRGFIPHLQKMYRMGTEMTKTDRTEYLESLFRCITIFIQRDSTYSKPFYPLFREAITSGLIFSPNLSGNMDLLVIIRELQLLQLFLNRMEVIGDRIAYQFILENIDCLNIVEFVMENKQCDSVVTSIFGEMKGLLNSGGFSISLFIKNLVFVRLRLLQCANDKLSVLANHDLFKAFNDDAYSIYYLKIFGGACLTPPPRCSTGRLRLMSLLSGFTAATQSLIYPDNDILLIIDDIKEIHNYGYDTSDVAASLIRNFSFSCEMSIHFYKTFGFIVVDNILVDDNAKELANLLVEAKEYLPIKALYKRAVGLSVKKSLIAMLRTYVEKYIQAAPEQPTAKSAPRMKMAYISLSSKHKMPFNGCKEGGEGLFR